MIKINLAPYEELESPLWWVPDAIVGIGVAMSIFVLASVYFYIQDREILDMEARIQSTEAEIAGYAADVKRYDELRKEVDTYNEKLKNLAVLVDAKVLKYQPVIILEHLQNLKPRGVWLESIDILNPKADPKNPQAASLINRDIKLTGYGIDNILVAELITALRSTQVQDVDAADIRTQLYFTNVVLESSELRDATPILNPIERQTDRTQTSGPAQQIPFFTLTVVSMERDPKVKDQLLSWHAPLEAGHLALSDTQNEQDELDFTVRF